MKLTQSRKKDKCPQCGKRIAIIDNALGVLPCSNCQSINNQTARPNFPIEFTSSKIKEERKKYAKSILQPYIGGKLSREYIEAYGTDKLAGVTKRDIKESVNVYKGELNSHNLHKSNG